MADQYEAEETAIRDLLTLYFDGLYFGDVDRLQRAFHPSAIYATVTQGKLYRLFMEEYWPVVRARVAPSSIDQQRRDRILFINFAGSTTAVAKVECAIGANFYTDVLTFVKLDGVWRIITKVFSAHSNLHI